MAFVITSRASNNSTSSGVQTLTSDAFTPTENSRLFVFAYCQASSHGNDKAWGIANTGGLSFTKLDETSNYPWSGDAGYKAAGVCYYADVGTPASMTVTIDPWDGDTYTGYIGLIVFDVTGFDADTPFAQASVDDGADVNPSSDSASGTLTLGGAPTNGNLVVAMFGAGADTGGGFTDPTGYTGITEQDTGYVQVAAFYKTDTTTAAVTCSDLGQSVGQWGGIIFEMTLDGGGGTTYEDALTISKELSISDTNIADLLASLSLSKELDISLLGNLDAEALLTLAKELDISFLPCGGNDYKITASNRDGYWTGSLFVNDSFLVVGNDVEETNYDIFLVYEPGIPYNAIITNATVYFRAYSNQSSGIGSPLDTLIHGVKEPSPSIPTSRTDCENATLTTNNVEWDIGNLVEGFWYMTPDITDIVQEIVNQTGFDENSYIILQVRQYEAGIINRIFNSYDDDASYAPIFCVEWVETPVIDAFLTLARSIGIVASEVSSLEELISLNKELNISFIENLIAEVSILFGKQLNINLVSALVIESLLGLSKQLDISITENISIEELISLTKELDIQLESNTVLESAVALAKELDISLSDNITIENFISLIKELDISIDEVITKEASISLAKELGISTNALLDIQCLLSLNKILDISTLSNAELYELITLSKELLISIIGGLVSEASVSLSKIVSILLSYDTSIEEVIQLTKELGVSIDDNVDMQVALTLDKVLDISLLSSAEIYELITLSKQLSVEVSGGLELEAVLSLSKILTILTLSEVVENVYEVALTITKELGISSSISLDREGNITLNKVLDFTAVSQADLLDSIELLKTIAIINESNVDFAVQIDLEKVIAVTVSGGLSLEESVVLGKELEILLTSIISQEAYLSLDKSLAIQNTALIDTNDQITLARELAIDLSTIVDFQASISLDKNVLITIDGGLNLDDAIALGYNLAILAEANVVSPVVSRFGTVTIGDTKYVMVVIGDE